jgi:hypothetical protein
MEEIVIADTMVIFNHLNEPSSPQALQKPKHSHM